MNKYTALVVAVAAANSLLPGKLSSVFAAQELVITGKITESKTGNPLPGVTVIAKGTKSGAFSKADGKYRLVIPAGSQAKSLQFRLVGMVPKEVPVPQGSNEATLDIRLEEDVLMTEDVVVTAVALEQKKKSIGYASQELKGDDVVQSRETNIVQSLAGKVAGVQINSSAGAAGASSAIRLRGITSISGDNDPLFVIDGVPVNNDEVGTDTQSGTQGVANSNRLIDLNPDDIESINVLKGPAATALYGIRAGAGVIIIQTKRGKVGSGSSFTYSSSIAVDEVNKLPELQTAFSQGTGGNYRGPLTGQSRSWGAKLDDLRWVSPNSTETLAAYYGKRVGSNPDDPNSYKILVPSTDARWATGDRVSAFDNAGNFFQTAVSYTNSLTMSGGNETSSYFFSAAHLRQNGIIPNNLFERINLRVTADHRLTDDFKATASVAFTNSGGTRIQQGSNLSGVMLGLLRTPTTFDNSNGYGKDGYANSSAYEFPDFINSNPNRNYRGNFAAQYDNPLWTVNKNQLRDNVDRIIGFAQLDYTPTDWFSVVYRLGIDTYSDLRKQEIAVGSRIFTPGRVYEHKIFNTDLNSDLIVTLKRALAENIYGTLTLGHNMYQSSFENLIVQGDVLSVPNFYDLSNATNFTPSFSNGKLRRAAFYGRAQVDFNNMLFINADLRNEWSTTLPQGNNSFMFGGGNVSFVFTELDALKGSKNVLSFGKLRLAVASVGKDALLYSTRTPYNRTSMTDGWVGTNFGFPYAVTVDGQQLTLSGFQQGTVLGNPNLKPESNVSQEIGVELKFFENRLSLDITRYWQASKDQILPVSLPGSTGYSSMLMNIGRLDNQGWEIVLGANLFKDKDFSVDATINWSKNINYVTQLAPGLENITLAGFTGTTVRAVAGLPYGTIFGKGFKKNSNGELLINSETGFPIIDDVEKPLGSVQPDWIGGFRLTASWKGLTVSGLLDVKKGGKMWNGTRSALNYFGTAIETMSRETDKAADGSANYVYPGVKATQDANGNWVSTGVANDKKVIRGQNWFGDGGQGNGFTGENAEDFVEDAGWTRLREVSVSYSLPSEIVSETPFRSIQVTATARNLWLSTNYRGVDPETSLVGSGNGQGLDYFNMPGLKGWTFNLRVGF